MTDMIRQVDRAPAHRGYVVMTYPRSGGTWFAQLLGSTGALGRPEDWFNGQGYRDRGIADYPLDRAGQRAMMLSRGMTENGVFGVKFSPQRLDDLWPDRWAEDFPERRFIHLVRRDRLARALSDVKAQQTRQFRASSTARGEPRYSAAMIRDMILAQAVNEARVQQYFALHDIAPLEIAYEDLLADAPAVLTGVAAFLGVSGSVQPNAGKIDLTIQRDATNAEWRTRFLAEQQTLDQMPALVTGRWERLIDRLGGLANRRGETGWARVARRP
jgi:LPS sulfotransferase NodH